MVEVMVLITSRVNPNPDSYSQPHFYLSGQGRIVLSLRYPILKMMPNI